MNKFFLLLFTIPVLFSCSTVKKASASKSGIELKFLDEYDIPYNPIFNSTTVGGLSGIDYDAINNVYYLICDDRSAINPARFYTTSIRLKGSAIDTVIFLAVNSLLQKNGSVFPNSRVDPFHTPDPEAIRYNTVTGHLVWSSEGERIIRNDTVILEDPSIYEMDITGKIMDSFSLPQNLHMQAIEKGPRQNGVLEGMTFTKNYQQLLVSIEEPLYEDGSRAGVNDSSGTIRIMRFDVSSKKLIGQYAYMVDPVAFPSTPVSAYHINGIPDILNFNDSQILVLERSFSTGRPGCTIKLFATKLDNVPDITIYGSLSGQNFPFARKKLILNMDDLGIYIDNIEGMCWGPRLDNGHRTLIFVADNNFARDEVNQFLLFEVLEK